MTTFRKRSTDTAAATSVQSGTDVTLDLPTEVRTQHGATVCVATRIYVFIKTTADVDMKVEYALSDNADFVDRGTVDLIPAASPQTFNIPALGALTRLRFVRRSADATLQYVVSARAAS